MSPQKRTDLIGLAALVLASAPLGWREMGAAAELIFRIAASVCAILFVTLLLRDVQWRWKMIWPQLLMLASFTGFMIGITAFLQKNVTPPAAQELIPPTRDSYPSATAEVLLRPPQERLLSLMVGYMRQFATEKLVVSRDTGALFFDENRKRGEGISLIDDLYGAIDDAARLRFANLMESMPAKYVTFLPETRLDSPFVVRVTEDGLKYLSVSKVAPWVGSRTAPPPPPRKQPVNEDFGPLKNAFAVGGQINRQWQGIPPTFTDDDIDALAKKSSDWVASTSDWIAKNLSPAAAERFLLITPQLPKYTLQTSHLSNVSQEKFDNWYKKMPQYLSNLDTVMQTKESYR